MNSQKLDAILESIQKSDTAPATGTELVAAVVPDDVETELAKDTLFDLLQNQRRRDALAYLKANDGRATLSEMAEHIAAKENDLPIEGINSKQRKRVYIGLYQCHLPKMANAGVVSYDKDRGTIELKNVAAQLYPYLDVDGDDRDGSAEATADTDEATGNGVTTKSSVLAGVGVAALAGVADVPGFELLSPVLWTVVCAVTLLTAAALPLVEN